MLKIENFSINLGGQPILKDIGLWVPAGEITVLIGPSGCGKSTLLKAVAGLFGPQEAITYQNKNICPKKLTLAYLPQKGGLLPWKTVAQNLQAALAQKQKSLQEALPYLKALDIGHLLGHYPNQLSGGQAQRAAMARALSLTPDLFLLDEPFCALDLANKDKAQDLFIQAWRQHPAPALFVTHDIKEALYLGTKIVVFSKGPGTILQTFSNPSFGKRRHDPDLLENIQSLLGGEGL